MKWLPAVNFGRKIAINQNIISYKYLHVKNNAFRL
jgi:hypothetical protein